MIQFWTSKYELYPLGHLGAAVEGKPRVGALFKVQWPNGNVGYADLFPWPELGDETLDQQISMIANGQLTPLVEQAIWLAKKDAAFRKTKTNAFKSAAKIKNHYLINDYTKFTDAHLKDLRSAGFTTLKIKVGRDVDEEGKFASRLIRQNPITVRLDFNSQINFSQLERFFSHLSPSEKPKIEFVEDPFTWDMEAWTEAAKIAPLAIDYEYSKVGWESLKAKPPFSIVVLKPARQDIDKALERINKHALKMVVTSSLDHPVGVAHACLLAAELKKFYPNTLLDCGCLSLKAYRANEFSLQIQTSGPYLKEISGTGIGFDELLQKAYWEIVKR